MFLFLEWIKRHEHKRGSLWKWTSISNFTLLFKAKNFVTEMRDKTNKCHLIEKFLLRDWPCLVSQHLHVQMSTHQSCMWWWLLHMWQIKTLVIYTKHNCPMVWKRIYEKSVHITSVGAEMKEESLCITFKTVTQRIRCHSFCFRQGGHPVLNVET